MVRPSMSGAMRMQAGPFRACAIAGACLTTGCLLTTSLDGLEGPPPHDDVRADGGLPDGGTRDAGLEDGPPDGSLTDGSGANGPYVVTRVGGTLRGLAEHGGDLFWVQTETSPGIARIAKLGGDPVFVHPAAQAFDVAADDTYVYWSTGSGNEVWRKAAAGGTAELLFPGAGETLYIARGANGRIYVTGADSIVAGPRADAGTSDALYLFQTRATGIAVNGSDIFWSFAAGIARGASGATSPAAPLYRGTPGEVLSVATDGRDVYWIDASGVVRALALLDPSGAPPREICRAARSSEGGIAPDGGARGDIADVAVDAEWIYFTDPESSTINKCKKP